MGDMELTTAPGDVSCRRIKSTLRVHLKTIEVAGMEESQVRFTRNMTPVGTLQFGCNVEYSSKLDPYLPGELKRGRDLNGFQARILPFNEGQGGFAACSLEQAEALEVEIGATIETAYQAFLVKWKQLQQWVSAGDHNLENE